MIHLTSEGAAVAVAAVVVIVGYMRAFGRSQRARQELARRAAR